MRNPLLRSAAVVGLASIALAAQAAPITYTFTTTGSGFLNGVTFTNAAVTFTAIGDTLNVNPPTSGPATVPVVATVNVAGIGNDSLAQPLQVFSDVNLGSVGLSQVSDIVGVFNTAALSGYDLTTAIGPVTGLSFGNPSTSYTTTRGTFRLSANPSATFTASLGAVPEPATMAALGLGAVALLRRKRKA